jgi:hypothetical protein
MLPSTDLAQLGLYNGHHRSEARRHLPVGLGDLAYDFVACLQQRQQSLCNPLLRQAEVNPVIDRYRLALQRDELFLRRHDGFGLIQVETADTIKQR